MYCGCNEVAQSSQAKIAHALISLMERKSFSSVTISELCREAGVSRPTFYSLFDSLEDVVRYILQASYCYKPEPEPTEESSITVFCRGYSRYISENRDFLSLLMRNGLLQVLYQSIEESLTGCGCFLASADPGLRGYAAHFAAGGLVGFIQNYTVGDACSEEAMISILQQLFSGRFFMDHSGNDPSGAVLL